MKIVGRLKNWLGAESVIVPHSYLTAERRAQVLARYRGKPVAPLGYATVEDFCESVDRLPEITGRQGDLKDVQRPWTVKALLGLLEPSATLAEIGAGLPDVAQVLTECGYRVIAVDPYEGAGNGPVEYEKYRQLFPGVDIRKQYFDETLQVDKKVDAVYSISTIEHIPDLEPVFRAIHRILKPGGLSLHCIDVVTRGFDEEYHLAQARTLLRLQGEPAEAWDGVLAKANQDVETYWLGPSGHQLWRGATPYKQYPYRKVMSLQTWRRF